MVLGFIYAGCTSGLLQEPAFIVCSTVACALMKFPEIITVGYTEKKDIL
jgi:hypothetical protein